MINDFGDLLGIIFIAFPVVVFGFVSVLGGIYNAFINQFK